MTQKQIEGIKSACKMVNSLRYTVTYKISRFDIIEQDDGDIRIDFQITRIDPFEDKVYKLAQDGTVYVDKKGKVYWINFLHNKKPVTLIGYTVTGFYIVERLK